MAKQSIAAQLRHDPHVGRSSNGSPTKRRHANRGAATVEFAIAITVLLMIAFGCIEFTRMSLVNHSVQHSSYLAARRAMIVGATQSEVSAAAEQHLQMMGIGNASVTLTPGTITDETEIVQVEVAVPVAGNSWISPLYFSGQLTGRTRILAERAAGKMAASFAPPAT